jgi:hypothetical protein
VTPATYPISVGILCLPNSTLNPAAGSLGESPPHTKKANKTGKKNSTHGLHTCLLTFLLYRCLPFNQLFHLLRRKSRINQDNFDIAFGQKDTIFEKSFTIPVNDDNTDLRCRWQYRNAGAASLRVIEPEFVAIRLSRDPSRGPDSARSLSREPFDSDRRHLPSTGRQSAGAVNREE